MEYELNGKKYPVKLVESTAMWVKGKKIRTGYNLYITVDNEEEDNGRQEESKESRVGERG